MQTETNTSTVSAPVTTDTGAATSDAPAVIVTATDSKPAKAARKPRAPKAATPAVIVAPIVADKPSSSFADERHAAALAVGAFYTSGPSLPFKSAGSKLSDINSGNVKAPSVRTAALVAAMLAYSNGNIKSDGTFSRGGFLVPARLINPAAKPGDMLHAMPESGCLGNMLGRVVRHVSGPIGGKQARDGIFKLDFTAARGELSLLGDAVAKPALAVLNKLAPAKPAKAA